MYVYFTIDSGATIGSTISNTANLSYQAANTSGGSSGGGASTSCPGISCPIIDESIQNTTYTANFVIENPKSIPSIKKCIINPPNSLISPIYQIGDIITYTVMIGNSGSGDLSTVVSDAMGMPGQNLEIIPGSITYDYYANQYTGYKYGCSTYFG